MSQIKQWYAFFLISLLLAFPSKARAQGEVKLDFLSIELWAEYDQPSMLIINEFVVSAETPLPAQVMLRFPKEGNLTAVASNVNGQLINAPFETPTQQGDWQTIALNVDSYAPYRIEYYQPMLREGNTRSFIYKWLGDYQVNEFRLTLSLPVDSREVMIDPANTFATSQDGQFLIATVNKNSLKMGHSYQMELEYRRDTESLTSPNAVSQVQPSEPLGEDTLGRTSVDNLPWIVGGIGIAMIGFVLILYRRSLQSNVSHSSNSRKRRGKRAGSQTDESQEEVYCHQCGTRAVAGDRFCRACGSKLRAR